jgi:hypothetical protein
MTKRIAIGAFSYLIPTFALGFVWHLVAFKGYYEALAIYRKDVIIPFGFLSMSIQAVSRLLPVGCRTGRPPPTGWKSRSCPATSRASPCLGAYGRRACALAAPPWRVRARRGVAGRGKQRLQYARARSERGDESPGHLGRARRAPLAGAPAVAVRLRDSPP